MKLTSIFLLATCLQVSATAFGQKVTISGKNISLRKVFKEIRKQTGYNFIYSNKTIREATPTTLNVSNADVLEVLKKTFVSQPLTYTIDNKIIIVKRKPVLPIAVHELPNKEITGVVSDSTTGQPLAGVTIKVKGGNIGTVTDAQGKFSLEVPDDAVLEVSYLGYSPKEISVDGRSSFSISLAATATGLNQLVVVGYGKQKKGNISGSIATVSNKDLTVVPVANVTNALAGKLPGLIAVQRSGMPGADGSSYSIRGFGSPLVVVDGVVGRSFDQLDPKEIESITILKDAASAAVYGVSGGNGVILVTTKRGAIGRPKLTYSFNYGLQHVTRYPELVNSAQYAILKNEASTNLGGSLIYTPEEIEKYRKGTDPDYPNFDYYNYFVRDYTPQIKQDLTVRGGNERVKYFFLLGGLKQEAMWKGDQNFSRYNFRSNVDAKITDNISISVQFGARYELRHNLIQNSYLMASWLQYSWPIFRPKTPDGKIAATNYGLTAYLDKDLTGYVKDERRRYIGNLTITYDIPFIEGLTAKIMASRDMEFGKVKDWEKKYYTYQWNEETQSSDQVGSRGSNFLTLATARITRTHIQPSLDYDRTFLGKHHVKALLLFDESEIEATNFSATRVGYVVPIDQLFAGPDLNKSNAGGASDDGRESLVGRVNYDYLGKYLFEYSFRYDGSARFPPATQWGYFQGFSAGWRISDESFIRDHSNIIDNLKLRASWGKLGDDATGKFQFLTGFTYPAYSYIFGGNIVTNGMVSSGIANPNITWEVSKTINIGLDVDLWNGLLGATIDVFNRNRSGLLAKRNLQLPSTFGASLPDENLNSDNTRGFEIILNHQNHIGPVNYSISVNSTFSKSRWEHVEEKEFSSQYDKWVNGSESRFKNRYFGLKAIGQFKSWKDIKASPIQDGQANSTLRPGDIKYEDFNQDGIIDAYDRQPLGRGQTPEINYGANIDLSWKNFNLIMNLQGASNFSMQQVQFLIAPFYNGMNAYAFFMDRWHREDMTDPDSKWIPGKYPSTINSGAPNNMQFSSFWLKDISYLRLKSLNLTYHLKITSLTQIGINGINLSLSGYNLFTFVGLPYIDPEAPAGRLSYYPQQKTYNIGINVQF